MPKRRYIPDDYDFYQELEAGGGDGGRFVGPADYVPTRPSRRAQRLRRRHGERWPEEQAAMERVRETRAAALSRPNIAPARGVAGLPATARYERLMADPQTHRRANRMVRPGSRLTDEQIEMSLRDGRRQGDLYAHEGVSTPREYRRRTPGSERRPQDLEMLREHDRALAAARRIKRQRSRDHYRSQRTEQRASMRQHRRDRGED